MFSKEEQDASNGSGGSEGAASLSNQSSPPAVALPKGGGAIRGIDEKFSVNSATGIGSLSIPIYTTSGHQDFHPQLSLSYNSGAGNGPFGLGWSLPVPAITRKTDKGLPLRLEDYFQSTHTANRNALIFAPGARS